ncbi:hypothetical protein J9303_19895 [Bacillaceae bacterium Marseille-Q3522]|nr:hypothetical protein [Bacillaceae bacterium Marseille-Q3522]
MWKTAFSSLLLLSVMISSILFWQWNTYSKMNAEKDGDSVKIEQSFQIVAEMNRLKITQIISGLKDENGYEVIIPKTSENWRYVQNEQGNETPTEMGTAYYPENGMLQFQYEIPLSGGNNAFFLSEWTTVMTNLAVSNTTIKIVDNVNRQGSWAAGIPSVAQKKFTYINYFVFKGNEQSPSLYWQPGVLQAEKLDNGVQLFLDETLAKQELHKDLLSELTVFPKKSIVVTDSVNPVSGNGLLIIPANGGNIQIEDELTRYYFSEKFTGNEDQLLVDVFSSAFLQKEPVTEKGRQLLAEIKSELPGESFSSFLSSIIKEKAAIDSSELDSRFSSFKGMQTNYFTRNLSDAAYVPLYYFQDKVVYVNDRKRDSVTTLIKDGHHYYPFMQLLAQIGYETTFIEDQHTIIVRKTNQHYRFYPDRNIFMYNDESYGVLENPLFHFDNTFYIDRDWLKAIFQIILEEQDKEIHLTI